MNGNKIIDLPRQRRIPNPLQKATPILTIRVVVDKDLRVIRVIKVLKVTQDHRDLKVIRVIRGHRVDMVLMVQWVKGGRQDLKV